MRKLLSELGPTNDVCAASRETFVFLFELLERHPKATTKLSNFKNMVVQRGNTVNGKVVYGLFIRYEDGTMDDISWKQCVNGKAPPAQNN